MIKRYINFNSFTYEQIHEWAKIQAEQFAKANGVNIVHKPFQDPTKHDTWEDVSKEHEELLNKADKDK